MTRICIRGARVHNLAGIDLDLPRDRLIAITGVSGSGKSSLAFDTIYAEGQRRYVEALSVHARQYLDRMDRPDVDLIDGLSPAIAIGQQQGSASPRSTVGTVTELADHLRLLYARVGEVYCYQCGRRIAAHTVQQIVDAALALPERARFRLLAPVARGERGELAELVESMRRAGFSRAMIDGEPADLSALPPIDANAAHDVDIVVDRLVVKADARQRIADSVELALRAGAGQVILAPVDGAPTTYSERFACPDCGISYPPLEPRLFSFNSPHGMCPACDGLGAVDGAPCSACAGSGLRPEARAVRVGGRSIAELGALPLAQARAAFDDLTSLGDRDRTVAARLVDEIRSRLQFLIEVGVPYLALDRRATTLSGGESQRIRLATQLGSSLLGVLYVLDEPSIGLHPRDTDRLLAALARLRDRGNTVIVVEHDERTIRAADYVVDIGPGAGVHGGHVVAAGTPEEIAAHPASLTGAYLSGRETIAARDARREPSGWLALSGARAHNLRGVDVRLPLGAFVCVTGVSGSGKSSLVLDTLLPALTGAASAPCDGLEGAAAIARVVSVDQSPIGRTPRSNPATYTGIFAAIRELFANLPDSKARGYKPGRYSFNVKGGRCEVCQGDGTVQIDMAFLPDVYVTCDACGGRRFNRETLDVRYKGLSIADVLELSVTEALDVFGPVPKIREQLESLRDVGLGYVALGQSATTLSGGEAQRLKLARELARRGGGHTLYVLDEPTTGLHFADVDRLLHVLDLLVDEGNTALVIEHDVDVIAHADHVIDLGPGAGADGGLVVASGTPEEIAANEASITGRYLRRNP